MRSATFLIKPASSLCDMRCRYCFYHDISDIREVKSMGLMSETTAQALIQAAFAAVEPGGFVQFTFQGGEPTLAGLAFFRKFMELEAQFRTKDVGVGHAIQTNGLHINEEWATFLKEHDFLVGVIDKDSCNSLMSCLDQTTHQTFCTLHIVDDHSGIAKILIIIVIEYYRDSPAIQFLIAIQIWAHNTGFHTTHNKPLEILMHYRLQAAALIGKLIVRQEDMQIHPLFSQYTANPVNILRKKLI